MLKKTDIQSGIIQMLKGGTRAKKTPPPGGALMLKKTDIPSGTIQIRKDRTEAEE